MSSCRPPAQKFATVVALYSALAIPLFAQEEPQPEPSSTTEQESAPERKTFLDSITVATTRSERNLGDTPSSATVIDEARILDELMIDTQDLVRYEPGVYVDTDPTRLGLSGFSIRGIGGNRVQTQVDGIPTADEFDFGPLAATRVGIDVANLQSVEVTRSAGSSLYGSDALGGVVSLLTKSPRDFLGTSSSALNFSVGYSGRNAEPSATLGAAGRADSWLLSLFLSGRQGNETENQGDRNTTDSSRTAANPIDIDGFSALAKAVRVFSDSNELELAAALRTVQTETSVFSSQRIIDFSFTLPPGGQFLIDVADVDAEDEQERHRLSLRQLYAKGTRWFDDFIVQAYYTDTETTQVVDERRTNTVAFFGPPSITEVLRVGTFSFDQESVGLEGQFQKVLGQAGNHRLTYGWSASRDRFDVLRDREDVDASTGEFVPSSLIFPTKYFPASDIDELGLFVQDEIDLLNGRLLLVPGVRFDRYELQPNENDQIFLNGNPGQAEPVGLEDSAVSPRLGLVARFGERSSLFAQYSTGFRAPPYSAVNNGFTNQAGGYQTLPNPDLEPERSRNLELGFRFFQSRGAVSVTYFDNSYEDFIDTATLGFNPQTFLLEFQPQNIDEVEISGFEVATDHRFGEAWRLRSALAILDGENVTSGISLSSIAPPELVLGLEFSPPQTPWSGSLVATVVDEKEAEDLPAGDFAAPGHEVLDLLIGYRFNERWQLRLGAFNLTDETYWPWANARGLSADSTVLDRYTSAGRHAAFSLRFST